MSYPSRRLRILLKMGGELITDALISRSVAQLGKNESLSFHVTIAYPKTRTGNSGGARVG